MSTTQKYIVNARGWVVGALREKGDPVELTPQAALYENVTLDEGAAKTVAPVTDPNPAEDGGKSSKKAESKK